MDPKLIIDCGMNDGSDSAYYLHRGFRVVAIEANPVLAAAGRERFAGEIESGRLVLLDVGIAQAAGEATFWVNEHNDEWSSFTREIGCRDGTPCHGVPVRCVPFSQVIAEHGVPYFLKIDIEGADIHCLRALSPGDLPAYLSIESHRLEYLALLHGLGYRAFKCVDQSDHNHPRDFDNEARATTRFPRLRSLARSTALRDARARRLVRSLLGRSRPLRSLLKGSLLPGPDPGDTRTTTPTVSDWVFPRGSSGPFGEETPGPWRDLESVAYNWLHYRFRHRGRGTLNMDGWFDFHARLQPPCRSSPGG